MSEVKASLGSPLEPKRSKFLPKVRGEVLTAPPSPSSSASACRGAPTLTCCGPLWGARCSPSPLHGTGPGSHRV